MVTLERLRSESADLLAPSLLVGEVGNALLTGIRRRRWTGQQADLAFSLFRRMPLRLVEDEIDHDRAFDLSRRYENHPMYDMLYVAVAERVRTTLITADTELRARLAHLSWVIGPDGESTD